MIPTDEEIKVEVVEEIAWNSRVDASDVKVEVTGGHVTLTGMVPTYGARSEAHRSALCVAGVRFVENQLLVRYPRQKEAVQTDEELRAKVRNVLLWNPEIDDAQIGVSVVSGRTILEGTVDLAWKIRHVEDLISNVGGVLSIDNRMSVVPTRKVTDRLAAEGVRRALDRRLASHSSNIIVTAERGTVTMTGTVPSWRERHEASTIANYTAGVLRVRNLLVVDSTPENADG